MVEDNAYIGYALGIAMRITILGLLLAGSANAAMITVNASGVGDYTRIQDAIDNASAGDTIVVYSGIYYENMNVTKQLILRGIGNPVVDAGGSGNAIKLAADGITLEGFTATGASDYPRAGINVTSSNNTLSDNNASSNNGYGIYLDSSSNNNTLSGNNGNSNGIGIYLDSSNNNTLSGNNGSSNSIGISLSDSSNNTLSGNNGSISLSGSSNNTLSGNNGGIYLGASSNYNTLSNNTASNNENGISLYDSSNNMLTKNIMTENKRNFLLPGSVYSDYSNYDNQIDTTNLVNEKPIYYIRNSVNTIYDSSTNAGTFYCINCINVTIQDMNLSANDAGIFFWNTTRSSIKNINVSNNENGVLLFDSSNNTLNDNNASNNENGISLRYSSNYNTLSNNNVSNNSYGIRLASSSNTLSNNNVSNNNNGISLWDYSSNNMLSNNNVSNNNNNGILLWDYSSSNTLNNNNASNNGNGISLGHSCNSLMGNGISLSHSSNNNTLNNNNASNNTNNGISLSFFINNNTLSNNIASNNSCGISLGASSNYNTLSGNNVSNNSYGISLYDSSNNTIYNNFFNNPNYIISGSNYWNTTKISGENIVGGPYLGGNFWANPNDTGFSQNCSDVNGDGICDQSYILDENNIDYLSISMNFTKDKIPPKSVRNLKNVSYTSAYINWTWSDPEVSDFDKVQIYINNKYKTSVLKGKQYYKAKKLYANGHIRYLRE